MNIQYDLDRLNEIINDFCNVTGLSITLLDASYNDITKNACSKQNFCTLIQKCNAHICLKSDEKILKKCAQTKEAAIHICDAGLLDAALPVIINEEIVGYIIMGQVRHNDEFFSAKNNLPEKLIPLLRDYYDNLPVYSYAQIKSALKITSAIITKMVSEKMIVMTTKELASISSSYIDAHLGDNLSLVVLCQKLNVSKNRLYKCFHQYFNCTISEYITRKRVEKASELLLNTDLPLSEVAEKTGFNDYSYFFKVFKKSTGCTPLEFRREHIL